MIKKLFEFLPSLPVIKPYELQFCYKKEWANEPLRNPSGVPYKPQKTPYTFERIDGGYLPDLEAYNRRCFELLEGILHFESVPLRNLSHNLQKSRQTVLGRVSDELVCRMGCAGLRGSRAGKNLSETIKVIDER